VAKPSSVILPGSTIGILGGGQLGRMTAMAARSFGYRVQVLDPDAACPARFIVDSCITAPLTDVAAAAELAKNCDVVTIEIEKVGLAAMRAAAEHAPVHPDARVLEIIQHRARQKEWLVARGFPVGPFRVVRSPGELQKAAEEIAPTSASFLKIAEGGYDGRGQTVLNSADDAAKAWEYLGADVCVLEQAIDIEQEISVMVARRARRETAIYPPALNHHKDLILDWSVIPAPIPEKLADAAKDLAKRIADSINIIGLLAIEMFVQKDGQLMVNELAPRPHNSYHASERACATSQFEQAVRAICDLPFGSVEVLRPAAIVNLLGDLWLKHPQPRFDLALATPGVRLHLYEKEIPKPGRKMGHLSAVAATSQEAVGRVIAAKAILDADL
jgi:5-(carboxyamino)imidazole ribonucleotide synthase